MNDFMIFEEGELTWTGVQAERIGTFQVDRIAVNLRNVVSFVLDESDSVIGIQVSKQHYRTVLPEEKQAALQKWLLANLL